MNLVFIPRRPRAVITADFNNEVTSDILVAFLKSIENTSQTYGVKLDIRFEERPIKRRKTKKVANSAPAPENPAKRKQRAKKGGLETGAVDGKTDNNTIFE